MQRVFHNEEDRKLVGRWLLGVITAYSAAAVMIVLISSLTAASLDTAIGGNATAAQVQSQTERMARFHAARRHYATQDAIRIGGVAGAAYIASSVH